MLRLLRNPIFAVAGWALAILLGVTAIVLGINAGNLGGTAKRSDPGEEGSTLGHDPGEEASTPGHETPADEQHEFFNIVVHTLDPDRLVGIFPYIRDLPSGAHWADGDRHAYRCAYMFLLDSQDRVVGRVTFAALERSRSYLRVNDKYMAESHERPVARYYGGEPIPIDPETGLSEWNSPERSCPVTTESYAPGVPEGPVPVIKFVDLGGKILETRDYSKVYESTTRGHEFRIVARTPDRVAVVAYEDGTPVMAVYYDRLSSGVTLRANVS
jgi:hypothetical protein